MLKIPRSSKSVLKYSDNSWPEHTFKYLPHKSCFFYFFQSKHTPAPSNEMNLISKYMEFISVFHHGKVETPNLTTFITNSVCGCFSHQFFQDKNGNLLLCKQLKPRSMLAQCLAHVQFNQVQRDAYNKYSTQLFFSYFYYLLHHRFINGIAVMS